MKFPLGEFTVAELMAINKHLQTQNEPETKGQERRSDDFRMMASVASAIVLC
jgi:hypothetical protein